MAAVVMVVVQFAVVLLLVFVHVAVALDSVIWGIGRWRTSYADFR